MINLDIAIGLNPFKKTVKRKSSVIEVTRYLQNSAYEIIICGKVYVVISPKYNKWRLDHDQYIDKEGGTGSRD